MAASKPIDQSGPNLLAQLQSQLARSPAAALKTLAQDLSTDLAAILKGVSGFDGAVSNGAARYTREAHRDKEIEKLPVAEEPKQRLRDAESGKLGPQAKANANQVLNAIKNMPAADQAQILKSFASDPNSDNATHIASILSSPAWKKMDPAQRAQMAQVLGAADANSAATVLANLDQLAHQNGDPLLGKDSQGQALVSNLATLATQPLNSKLSSQTNGRVLNDVLKDIVQPGGISQGNYNSCGAASMQNALASSNPAEYARLMAGLSGQSGSVQMQGGATLTLPPEGNGATDNRSLTSRMFQNSAMDYAARANGGSYDATQDQVSGHFAWERGLNGKEESALGGQLFGQKYQSWQTHGDADQQINFLNGYQGKGPAIVNVNLSTSGGTDNHSLALDRSQGGRMYFKDPGGAKLPTPPFQKEANGEVSVQQSWVKDHLVSVIGSQDGNNQVTMGSARADQTIGNAAVDGFQSFVNANPWAQAILNAAQATGLGQLATDALRSVMNNPNAEQQIANNPFLAAFLPKDQGGNGGGNGGSTGGGKSGGGYNN